MINPQFDYAEAFDGHLASVGLGHKYGAHIDRTGKYIINPQFDNARGDFEEGLAAVKGGTTWGYIDDTGKYAINPQFDEAFAFGDGLV